jgi:hypothetical protein
MGGTGFEEDIAPGVDVYTAWNGMNWCSFPMGSGMFI